MRQPRSKRGFTLVEVVIVVILIGVIAAACVPLLEPSTSEQLYSAAHIVASDIQYCRDLAVTNNSNYRVDFNVGLNRYEISHQGVNTALDSLTPSAFLMSGTGAGGKPIQFNALDANPGASGSVKIHQLTRDNAPSAASLEFTGVGALATTAETVLWLTSVRSNKQMYVPITINQVTGDVRVGQVTDTDGGNGP